MELNHISEVIVDAAYHLPAERPGVGMKQPLTIFSVNSVRSVRTHP